MSNYPNWVVVDKYQREVRRFSGPSAGLQAQSYARMIKGSAYCVG